MLPSSSTRNSPRTTLSGNVSRLPLKKSFPSSWKESNVPANLKPLLSWSVIIRSLLFKSSSITLISLTPRLRVLPSLKSSKLLVRLTDNCSMVSLTSSPKEIKFVSSPTKLSMKNTMVTVSTVPSTCKLLESLVLVIKSPLLLPPTPSSLVRSKKTKVPANLDQSNSLKRITLSMVLKCNWSKSLVLMSISNPSSEKTNHTFQKFTHKYIAP